MNHKTTTTDYGCQLAPRETHEHRRSEVELVEELRDVNVSRDEAAALRVLEILDDSGHPLEVALRPRHPDEVNLEFEGRAVGFWYKTKRKTSFPDKKYGVDKNWTFSRMEETVEINFSGFGNKSLKQKYITETLCSNSCKT